MTDRPTPEQRKEHILDVVAEAIDGLMTVCDDPYLHGRLASIEDVLHECRIVHPDDVPTAHAYYFRNGGGANDARQAGWNDCRTRIFGAG